MKKKREYNSSELVKSFAKLYGFEDKLLALQVKDFLKDYLDEALFSEIESVNLKENILEIMDRREAIALALRSAKSGDVVVSTGKGSESWIHGAKGEKTPWDERKVFEEELAKTK